jgi:HK97 family phage major capsid protein
MSDETILGSEVKALEGGKIGGYLVRFSTAIDPDVTSDYFDAETELKSSADLPVLYQHGQDATMKRRVIGTGITKTDDVGLWIEAQLNLRDEYENAIYELAKTGKLGWSSGALAHLVEREPVGKAYHIKSWWIGEASLTPNPAEPRNTATIKSVLSANDQPETPQATDGSAGTAGATAATIQPDSKESKMSETKADFTITGGNISLEAMEQVAEAAAEKAAIKAVEAFKASAPAPDTAGHLVVTKDEADKSFKSLGEFLQAVKNAAMQPYQIDPRLLPLKETKAASGANEANPSEGGFLLQNQYAPGLIEKVYSTGAISSLVASDEVGPNSNGMTYKRVVETSRADGSRWGGLRSYWTGEAAAFTPSKPAWGELELKLKKLTALFYATDEMLEDSTALGSYVNRIVPQELAFKLDTAILNGTGAGQPLGVLTGAGLLQVAKETNQAADTILYENIIKMWARRFTGYKDYVWLVSQDSQPQLDTLAFAVGTGVLPPNFISYNNEGILTIKGRPVIETEQNPKLGEVGDLLLFSPSGYQMIKKGGVAAASSMHVLFTTDEMAYRWILRADGQPTWNVALTPYNGSGATVSPYVAIAERA